MKHIAVGAIAALAANVVAGVVATEVSLHRRGRRPNAENARAFARETGAAWEAVDIPAADGAILRAWLFTPANHDGAVLLLHGVNDNREGMLPHARYLLRAGFAVLMPDSRGHGESGGAITTYGVLESDDVLRWAKYLRQAQAGPTPDAFRAPGTRRVGSDLEGHPERVEISLDAAEKSLCGTSCTENLYGLGVSLGAGILLQSFASDAGFRAVAADSPFASFPEIASDRLAEFAHLGRRFFRPMVESGLLYARARYGLDLRRASPARAIEISPTPVLLIHGTADEKTPLRHSLELHAIQPQTTLLWKVPGARHMKAISVEPEAYPRKVVQWFQSH